MRGWIIGNVSRFNISKSLDPKDPMPASLSQNFRLVTRYFRLCGTRLRRVTELLPIVSSFIAGKSRPASIMARIVALMLKYLTMPRPLCAKLFIRFYLSVIFPQRQDGDRWRDIKDQGYLYIAIKTDVAEIVSTKNKNLGILFFEIRYTLIR